MSFLGPVDEKLKSPDGGPETTRPGDGCWTPLEIWFEMDRGSIDTLDVDGADDDDGLIGPELPGPATMICEPLT